MHVRVDAAQAYYVARPGCAAGSYSEAMLAEYRRYDDLRSDWEKRLFSSEGVLSGLPSNCTRYDDVAKAHHAGLLHVVFELASKFLARK